MSSTVTVLVLGGAVLFILGGLIGHSLCERSFDDRSRRQAEVQRRIAERLRQLREIEAARAPLRCAPYRLSERSVLATDADGEEVLT